MISTSRHIGPYERRVVSIGVRLTTFVAGIAIIAFWTYLFGHPIVEGGVAGSDSGYHLSIISWLDRWFPKIPGWYPLQGAGTSSIIQYPYAAHFFVVLLSRATGISLVRAFRLTQFLSVAGTAGGVCLLVWRKFGSQSMALIAGMLFPISQASWRWLAAIRLFSQSVSLVLFAPAFMLFDAYLLNRLNRTVSHQALKRRALLLGCAVAFGLMIVTHPTTAIVFSMTILLYSMTLRPSSQVVRKLAFVAANVGRSMVGLGSGVALACFWLVPFFHVNSLATRNGVTSDYGLSQMPYLDLLSVAGLRGAPTEHPMWAVTIASPVLILAAIGLILSIKRNRLAFVLGLISAIFALFTAMPGIWLGIVSLFEKLWVHTNTRALIPTMLFLPAVAGYGAVELPRRLLGLAGRVGAARVVQSRRGGQGSILRSTVAAGAAGMIGLGIAAGSFVILRHAPPGYGDYPGYGVALRDEWWPFKFNGWQVSMNDWPSFTMSENDDPNAGEIANELADTLGLNQDDRVEISPLLGALLEVFPLYSDSSTVSAYFYEGSLIRGMKGYQTSAYWKPGYGTTREVDDLASWLGIEYVVMDRFRDQADSFSAGSWESIALPDDKYLGRLSIKRFREASGLASVLTVPRVLVISGEDGGLYQQAFRLFNAGAMPLSKATVVEGESKIDDYSPQELARFDMVFLHGYQYKDNELAWGSLEQYVSGGGSLFFDTGWQYWVPDWELADAPRLFPFESLSWLATGDAAELSVADDIPLAQPNLEAFAPMLWNDQPWGISSSSGNLRNWVVPVLKAGDLPIVTVGEYGAGKVIWSGMNLIGHILTYGSPEETSFLTSLLQWGLPAANRAWQGQVAFNRDYPDSVTLSITGKVPEGSSLLWREAYAPGWHASVELNGVAEPVPIYRAGPGMMLLDLPESDGGALRIDLNFKLGVAGWIGKLLSSLALAAAAMYVVLAPRKYKQVQSPINGHRNSGVDSDLPPRVVIQSVDMGAPRSFEAKGR